MHTGGKLLMKKNIGCSRVGTYTYPSVCKILIGFELDVRDVDTCTYIIISTTAHY